MILQEFMFATGIENSYPSIVLPDGKRFRVDEMAKANHYQLWKEDFRLVKELGIKYLRYGPPYYSTHLAPGKYDWSFTDESFKGLEEAGLIPIVDLCHFGVPDWLGDFQNEEFPYHFAEYAAAFVRRFPHLKLYTPVNEINICAVFSAQFGWWNEKRHDEKSFVTAVKNMSKANILAMEEILKVQKEAVFIQSEGWEYFHSENDECTIKADFLNQKRFLSYDFTSGHLLSDVMQEYILSNGMTEKEYRWFLQNGCDKSRWIIGADYYAHNEHMVHKDGHTSDYFHGIGFYKLARQYYDRYEVPIMYTETNISTELSISWLKQQWNDLYKLFEEGIPVVGFTWYSLIDQVDWDTALRENNGHVNTFGLYDINRSIRPAGELYRDIIREYKNKVNLRALK